MYQLEEYETERRHATLVDILLDTTATLTDEILNLHDRLIDSLFTKAKHKYEKRFRDETYQKGLAELVNYQHRLPFAAYWGEGNASSSDRQRFRAGGQGQAAGYRNAKYGSEQGVLFYTHIPAQYAPFHSKVINSPVYHSMDCCSTWDTAAAPTPVR